MSEKYEMASPQWLAALHAFFVAARPLVQFTRNVSLCEVYRDVPSSIPSANGTIAFTVRFRKDSNDVEFELAEAAEADMKLVIDYAHVLPAGRVVVGGDPAKQREMEGIIGKAIQSGHATVAGRMPAELQSLPVHDQIARLTA